MIQAPPSPDTTRTDSSALLLRQLGAQVRRLRKDRSWSRRELAAASSVSERHLAELENGRGNISVALLARVATALDASLRDLFLHDSGSSAERILIDELVQRLSDEERQVALRKLREWFPPAAAARGRLALIGLRGAGKTTLGRKAAARMNVPFIRLRDEIQRLAGMDVSEIFSLAGETRYRRLEERALEAVLQKYDRCVLETGGSIVTDPRLLNLLLGSCYVVWITARPEDHMQRVVDQADLRPMADHADAMSDLRHILETRTPFYRQAHATLNTSDQEVDDCAAELVRLFGSAP